MERNWELVREILSRLESKTSTRNRLSAGEIGEYEGEFVSYHIQLLIEAGLVEGNCSGAIGAPLDCWATRLTWHGHEFLDQIRTDTVWNKTKKLLKEKGIGLSFEAITTAAKVAIGSLLE